MLVHYICFTTKVDSVVENWAFMPKELFSNIEVLRANNVSSKVYGVDGTAVFLMLMIKIMMAKFPRVMVTRLGFILAYAERGGSSYYALDISNPENSPPIVNVAYRRFNSRF